MLAHTRSEPFVDVTLLGVPFRGTLAARKVEPAGHVGVVGRADELKDAHALLDVGFAFEDGFQFEHFAEDAAADATSVFAHSTCHTFGCAYPTPHMSIAGVYFRNVSSNSGGRYHLVTTKLV